MEPDNIDWENIDSTFAHDDAYENFDAPMWVDLSAFDESLVDDEAWFCSHGEPLYEDIHGISFLTFLSLSFSLSLTDCKHPKTAQDFLKRTTTRNSKVATSILAKLLRFATISEILPFRDRNRRENCGNPKCSERSRRPSSSGKFYEDSENRNPNFSAPLHNKVKKTKRPNPTKEWPPVKSNRKSQLKSTFSAQNLLGGREIMSQISGLCSELKRLARGKKGTSEKGSSLPSGVSEQVKESVGHSHRERVPLLVVKDSRKGHS
ncbi:hypothetical protein CR513_22464, partial [Mucuna pruriens]